MSWKNTRDTVIERDDAECRYCGMTNEQHVEKTGMGLEAHHIIPSMENGPDKATNLVTVCRSCHRNLEHTQSKALAEYKNTLREELLEELEEPDDPEVVRKDAYYWHDDYGAVCVRGFESEVVGASTDGVEEKVVVEFVRTNATDGLVLRELVGVFCGKVGDPAVTYTGLGKPPDAIEEYTQ